MSQQQYKSVLKSSSLIGGSALINMLIGMVKTKFVAILLGPTGVGLAGIYTTLLSPISSICAMGIASSGVRQIAAANATGDDSEIAKTVMTLRRTVWGTGALGCLVTIGLSPLLATMTFKDITYAWPIAFLGVTVLLGNISTGQLCVIQGTRRIRDVALISVFSAFNGALISVPCYYLWGQQGIVVSLILCAVASLFVSWRFARRVPIAVVRLKSGDFIKETKKLLGLGMPIMLTGLIGGLNAYFLRLIILDQFELSGVGVWGSAFNISSILVGFVLHAMGTDYYPRLTGVAHDNKQVSREVNVQTEIALILAAPALLGTLLFAPLAIKILYSSRFDAASQILQWSVLGMFGRVVMWPLGFIILAKGLGRLFLLTEILANLSSLGLTYSFAKMWGINGTGMAFAVNYAICTIVMVVISWIIAETRWSWRNIRLIGVISGLLLIGEILVRLKIHSWIYYTVASILVTSVGLWSIVHLSAVTGLSLAGVVGRFYRRKNG